MLKGFKKKKIKIMSSKVAMHTYLSTITLNVNGLNAPIKSYTVADTNIHCFQETLQIRRHMTERNIK